MNCAIWGLWSLQFARELLLVLDPDPDSEGVLILAILQDGCDPCPYLSPLCKYVSACVPLDAAVCVKDFHKVCCSILCQPLCVSCWYVCAIVGCVSVSFGGVRGGGGVVCFSVGAGCL